MLVTILNNKVNMLGGRLEKIGIKAAQSQYDFTDDSFNKHELNERTVTLSNGEQHQRDLMAAFNLQHYDTETKTNNREEMIRHYQNFCKLEQEEINRHETMNMKKMASYGKLFK